MHAITQGLLDAGHTVKVLTVETGKHPLKQDKLGAHYIAATGIEAVYLNTELKPLAMLASYITGSLYIMERFNAPALKQRVEELLQQQDYDVVILESLFVAPCIDTIRQYSKAKIVLRAHNIEHLIWKRILDNTTNVLKKLYLKSMIPQLKDYEVKSFSKVDGVAAISTVDEQIVKQLAPAAQVETIPLTTNFKPIANVVPIPNTIFHLGSMDWLPNLEGVTWFLTNVWPLVIAKNANAHLYLAGRNMPQSLLNQSGDTITITGEVSNPADYMASKALMVVPLFSGSGVRVKIIEGMALGKAIVATPIAAEGLAVTPGEDIFIANTAAEYAETILQLLNEPDRVEDTGKAAISYINSYHRQAVVIEKLERFIVSL